MNFSVGYQFFQDDSLIAAILKRHEKIKEVYFSWGNIPNGRNTDACFYSSETLDYKLKQIEQLKKMKENGINLNLLLNGNCYGKYAQSRAFFNKIGDTIDFLKNKAGVDSVTTTSPLIAKFIKQNFDDIEVRASVNMEIGTSEGMDYIADWFDSFYLKREYNRDINKIKNAKKWCDENGKKLFGLANSGCLNFCSTHVFHDNLVAHESEIAEMDNAYQFEGQCWQYLKKEDKKSEWLRITNFIRPEEVALYEGYFDGLKLATRVSKFPLKIISAYCDGSYSGNLPEILEPNHAGLFYPKVIENKKIPDSFAETVLNCSKNCEDCGYCREVQKNATVILE